MLNKNVSTDWQNTKKEKKKCEELLSYHCHSSIVFQWHLHCRPKANRPFQRLQYRPMILHESTWFYLQSESNWGKILIFFKILCGSNTFAHLIGRKSKTTISKKFVVTATNKKNSKSIPDCSWTTAALSVDNKTRHTKSPFLFVLQLASVTCGVSKWLG